MRPLDKIRRYTSIGSGVALVGVSLRSAYFNSMAGRSFAGALAFVSGFSALGIGLVLQNTIARRLTAALCVCLAWLIDAPRRRAGRKLKRMVPEVGVEPTRF